MTAKEMFYKLGFDLKEDTYNKKIYVLKTGNYNEVIIFINDIQEIRFYTENQQGEKQPFTICISQRKYQAIEKQKKELGWLV